MKSGLWVRPIHAAILCAVFCSCTVAFGQGTNRSNNNSDGSADEYPDKVELDAFGGLSLFSTVNSGLGERFIRGGTAGGRATYNFSRYVGIELGYNFMVNNVRLITPIRAGLPQYNFGNQIHYAALNPVFNLRPRGSLVQPYLTAGVGIIAFKPTALSERQAIAGNATYLSGSLGSNELLGVNYGGGVKFHLSEHFGLRFDVRGLWSRNPTFHLPSANDGGIWIPSGNHLNALEATLGFVVYLGARPPVAAPPPPPPSGPLNAGSITGGEGILCQGKAITLHSSASDPLGHRLMFAWKLNGSPAGSNSADFSFTPNNAGDFTASVTISDTINPARSVSAGPVTLTVQQYVEPQITSISATPTELSCAGDPNGVHTASLAGQATGSACGGNLTYKWTVSEGSVNNDTSPNATFDASAVSFEGGAQGQAKTVTATLTVTDETGKTASQSTNVSVKCPPQFVRLDDVIFARNNARVNNCGKRILIDDAAPRVSSGDYDIVLVGHRDTDEEVNIPGRERRRGGGRPLDEQRVLNSAAVLSGGTGTCAKVDPSRIRVDWVGTDQTSETRPGLCGTSNVRERKGSRTSAADKNRRVEVYLVPRNSQAVPPAVKNIKPLPEREVKALGCPK